MKKKNFKRLLAVLASLTMITGMASNVSAEDDIVIRYAMWDTAQQPAYEQICANFEAENPGVDVQIELIPYADYFTKLTTQASGGSCPDVMTMFILSFKTLQSKGVLEDLTPYIEESGLDLSKYNETALDAFTVDEKIYGVPKDFDSIATFYNMDLLKAAGYEEYPQDLEWNLEDGGSYIKFLQDLTLDANGLHPYDEGFDSANIVQYGLLPIDRTDYTADGIISTMITENGGRMINEETSEFTLSEEKSAEAMEFIWKMTNEWYVTPPVSVIASTGAEAIFYSGIAATWLNGPWMTSTIAENCTFEYGVTRNVKGPTGESVSRVNSLIDCVYSGSEHKDIAYKLVEYIATEGQEVLGSTGTVIPAHSDYSQTYVDYYKEKGFDVQVFIDAYNGTVAFPPNLNEFSRADEVVQRQMALAMDGTGTVSMAETIETIESEVNGFLKEAN